MHCSDFMRAARHGMLLCCVWLTAPALAHKGSDGYIQLKLDATVSVLRVDLALRDLDAATRERTSRA